MRKALSRSRLLVVAVTVAALAATTSAPAAAAPPPISGTHPWIVVLCKFTDLSTEPSTYTPSYFAQMFAGTGYSGTLNFQHWWSEISYGNLSVAGTKVTSQWYSLGMTRYEWAGLRRDDKIRACANAAVSDSNINNDFSPYYGVIAIFNDDSPPRTASTTTTGAIGTGDTTVNVANASVFPAPPFAVTIDDGSQPNGGNSEEVHVTGVSGNTLTISRAYEGSTAQSHNSGATVNLIDGGDLGDWGPGLVGTTINGKSYNLGLVVLPPETNIGSAQHETGHGFGYIHSRALSTSTTDYQDCYETMSFDVCRNFGASLYTFQGDFGAAGILGDSTPAAVSPGLDAIDLDIQNWMPSGRTYNFSNSSCTQTTRDLAALNHPEASGDMEIRIPASLTIPNSNSGTTTSDYYTIELRDKSLWDRGIPQNAVLLHLHGLDGRSYWVDKFGSSFVGHSGAMYLGDEFADAGDNVIVAVNRMDASAHTATVALAAGGTGGSCKINASLTYSGDTSGEFNDQITPAADLVVSGTSVPIPNASVSFTFGSQSCSGTTDASGHASCSTPITIAQDPPGPGTISASFAGDSAYNAATGSASFTLNQEESAIAYNGATAQDYNDAFTASAKLTDPEGGAPISNKQVIFTLGSQSCMATTGPGGNASCPITITQDPPGPGTITASFSGDTDYLGASTSPSFTINREESRVLYTGPLTIHYHDPFTAMATFTDPVDGLPIANKQVTFTLGGLDTCSATTDTSGKASCPLTPHLTGTQNLVASFAGDVDYLASSDTKSFAITPEETTMTYTGPTVILGGASGATLTAKLVEDGSNDSDGDGGSPGPIPAEGVTLSVGSQSCSGTTDASGNVTCTIPSVTVPLGTETVKAAFAGDAYYQPASDSKVAIVFAFPSSGAFALGDRTVASATASTSLTWWGHSWADANSLTDGSAPSAFKGFADSVTTLPTTSPANVCGTTFSTRPGNSSQPPSSVPSYMGVLVTSSTTKSGSAINGSWGKIVVVKTDSGYSGNPGHPGTGTIVATFCP
jgi:hypothetical protein